MPHPALGWWFWAVSRASPIDAGRTYIRGAAVREYAGPRFELRSECKGLPLPPTIRPGLFQIAGAGALRQRPERPPHAPLARFSALAIAARCLSWLNA